MNRTILDTRREAKHDPIKREGKHYTPLELASFVAAQLVAQLPVEWRQKQLRVLDPALGDGSLLEAIGLALRRENFESFQLCGMDTDAAAMKRAEGRLSGLFSPHTVALEKGDFLERAMDTVGGHGCRSLFAPQPFDLYDVVIANPPYVRTQVLGADRAQEIARDFALVGRVDLYHAFIEGISRILVPDGHAGIIVSNRFLTTRSGAAIRRRLVENFNILHVWDLGDTKFFQAAVLPALLFLRRKGATTGQALSRFSSIYACEDRASDTIRCETLVQALDQTGTVTLPDASQFLVQHGNIDFGKNGYDVWRLANARNDEWLSTVDRHTAYTFGDVGKVRVGVKTTADRVFIRSDWAQLPPEEQPELLRPLLTHLDAQRFRAKQGPTHKQILYTHTVIEGVRTAVDLNQFPRTRRYLEKHRPILEKRDYVLNAGRSWYEIWVPQDPDAWALPKLVFRDISEAPVFWLDLSGAVVNGDCYWLSVEREKLDLLWLALGVANSQFIERYYDRRFNNKLYAGRRRFMTQYVEMFPLPNPDIDEAQRIVSLARQLHSGHPAAGTQQLEAELNEAVCHAFGLRVEEI